MSIYVKCHIPVFLAPTAPRPQQRTTFSWRRWLGPDWLSVLFKYWNLRYWLSLVSKHSSFKQNSLLLNIVSCKLKIYTLSCAVSAVPSSTVAVAVAVVVAVAVAVAVAKCASQVHTWPPEVFSQQGVCHNWNLS